VHTYLRIVETLTAFGHEKIKATHPTTLEITKEKHLTSRGDCIVAVGASKGAADLSSRFKGLARDSKTKIVLILEARGFEERIEGQGDPNLMFTNLTDLVARKSSYVCPRTLMVKADKAAADIPRGMVENLRDANCKLLIKIVAER
jgi:hypothetical protein